jgi:hypothetical protein
MSLSTIDTKQLHSDYEESSNDIKYAIDEAFNAAVKILRHRGIQCSNADPAEELVAAIFHYIKTSKEL